MTWLGWIGLAVVITAFAAITGIKPKGTEHLAHTRMMTMARLALLVLVVILGVAYVLGRARSHG
jgi:choline-glycine betaine transporter